MRENKTKCLMEVAKVEITIDRHMIFFRLFECWRHLVELFLHGEAEK